MMQKTGIEERGLPLFTSRELTFAAGYRVIVKPLDLELAREQVYGLIGHNGSGKSTFLKMLARQNEISSGSLELFGTPLQGWGQREFAQHIGYLPQDLPLVPGLMVKELVAHGRYPWHGAFRRMRKNDHDLVEEAMVLTGIDQFADRMVDTLSGGERQRVWIAMLIAQDAKCLLLDEPISALDISHQVEVLSLIQKLSRQKGLSVIMVLHDVNMAARYCDQIIALKQGSLIAHETPEQIMQTDTLKEIFDIDLAVIDHPKGQGSVAFVE